LEKVKILSFPSQKCHFLTFWDFSQKSKIFTFTLKSSVNLINQMINFTFFEIWSKFWIKLMNQNFLILWLIHNKCIRKRHFEWNFSQKAFLLKSDLFNEIFTFSYVLSKIDFWVFETFSMYIWFDVCKSKIWFKLNNQIFFWFGD
jgi:hypothetical protein